MALLEKDCNSEEGILGVRVPPAVYRDKVAFIQTVREGISGSVVKQAIHALGDNRELFVRLLETTPGNLHRFYKRKALSRTDSEEVLDVLRVYYQTSKVFGDRDKALRWLNTSIPALSGEKPLDLFDTFEGRQLVREVLRKVEYGEFS
ncbi:antitoxin Xre/MbcA/ParS toxin-binding domain-containing protein [Halomonas faecis]|uniref:antitoxin Xre/MbcA/ParS toxin-binding domain-containing protein n=1 Tax=Halomonas faecis TaxID=1562110 RepID=UPI0013D3BEAC|nr:antitoxin Xre/MbcA/ParS toxin-binding domain-containing protein [Halomonas faecis]